MSSAANPAICQKCDWPSGEELEFADEEAGALRHAYELHAELRDSVLNRALLQGALKMSEARLTVAIGFLQSQTDEPMVDWRKRVEQRAREKEKRDE